MVGVPGDSNTIKPLLSLNGQELANKDSCQYKVTLEFDRALLLIASFLFCGVLLTLKRVIKDEI